jgi:hypothetical protein
MPPKPETGLVTLPEVVTGNLTGKLSGISLYNQQPTPDFELGSDSYSNSTSPWAIVCESATQPSRADSPLSADSPQYYRATPVRTSFWPVYNIYTRRRFVY